MRKFCSSVPIIAFAVTVPSICHGDFVTASYNVGAETFQDSNSNPPMFPSTTTVRGGFTFTFDRVSSENAIVPESVIGIEIRDNNGFLHVYDETNAGVNTQVNQFADFARITFGGNTGSPASIGGLTDDFRVIFDIDTVSGAVTNVHDKFSYVSTVDPFYAAQTTVVLLSSYNVQTADVDNDGDVDGADFLIIQCSDPSLIPPWETEYGNSGAQGAANQHAVPEPSAQLLCLALAGYATTLRRGKAPLF